MDEKNTVLIREIVASFDKISGDRMAYVNIHTGELKLLTTDDIYRSETIKSVDDDKETLSKEIIEAILYSDDYLPLPAEDDINDYEIMIDFIYTIKEDEVRNTLFKKIRGRGTFRRFKAMIRHYQIEEDWITFKKEAFHTLAIDWCESNGLDYKED